MSQGDFALRLRRRLVVEMRGGQEPRRGDHVASLVEFSRHESALRARARRDEVDFPAESGTLHNSHRTYVAGQVSNARIVVDFEASPMVGFGIRLIDRNNNAISAERARVNRGNHLAEVVLQSGWESKGSPPAERPPSAEDHAGLTSKVDLDIWVA